MSKKEISAGGVVYRHREGKLEIQLIQDRYGKMTLAKGKMEPGETTEQTALREIEEETGIVGRIIMPLDVISYEFTLPQHGVVHKQVHYFLVEALSGSLQPQIEEIRDVKWYEPMDAWNHQLASGYDNNDRVLRKALDNLGYEVSDSNGA